MCTNYNGVLHILNLLQRDLVSDTIFTSRTLILCEVLSCTDGPVVLLLDAAMFVATLLLPM